jgi:broad specificity phosphatase PhoE
MSNDDPTAELKDPDVLRRLARFRELYARFAAIPIQSIKAYNLESYFRSMFDPLAPAEGNPDSGERYDRFLDRMEKVIVEMEAETAPADGAL